MTALADMVTHNADRTFNRIMLELDGMTLNVPQVAKMFAFICERMPSIRNRKLRVMKCDGVHDPARIYFRHEIRKGKAYISRACHDCDIEMRKRHEKKSKCRCGHARSKHEDGKSECYFKREEKYVCDCLTWALAK